MRSADAEQASRCRGVSARVDEYAALAPQVQNFCTAIVKRSIDSRGNAALTRRRRGVCAAHTLIERLPWTNASVKALLRCNRFKYPWVFTEKF